MFNVPYNVQQSGKTFDANENQGGDDIKELERICGRGKKNERWGKTVRIVIRQP